MHCDGTNLGTYFLDYSGLVQRTPHTFSLGGNVCTKTAVYKFGTASAAFDGTGDYIQSAATVDWYQGSLPFTVSFYARRVGTVLQYLYTMSDGTSTGGLELSVTGSVVSLLNRGRTTITGVLNTDVWTHIAVIGDGVNIYLYSDGALQGQMAYGGVVGLNYLMSIGANWAGASSFNGYIDEFAYWKGVAIPISELSSQTAQMFPRDDGNCIRSEVMTPNYVCQSYTIHPNTVVVATTTITVPTELPVAVVDVFLIGGGGSGGAGSGNWAGGGGGAGAYLQLQNIPLSGQATLVVGAGGTPKLGVTNDGTASTLIAPGLTILADGGGGGASTSSGGTANGNQGGCCGGPTASGVSPAVTGNGIGYNGGPTPDQNTPYNSNGGGGTGSVGAKGNNNGNTQTQAGLGGNGFQSLYSGFLLFYGGGGGGAGGWYANNSWWGYGVVGGSSIGGSGGNYNAAGQIGVVNTGSGGGGGGGQSTYLGGNGTAGTIVVRWINPCTLETTTIGGYQIDKYTINVATGGCVYTWNSKNTGQVEYVVVAGGGGGGSSYLSCNGAGGGGAGGFRTASAFSVTGYITVIIGNGGVGGLANQFLQGTAGLDSQFSTIVATGGGGGGQGKTAGAGGAGGSSGGGGWSAGIAGVKTASPAQGNNGAAAVGANGGGGGGAGGAGILAAGGAATASTLIGVSTLYAAGGGAGLDGYGGSGIGGNGSDLAPTGGAPNTGSGGGGAYGPSVAGGNGSAGIVIVKFLVPSLISAPQATLGSANMMMVG